MEIENKLKQVFESHIFEPIDEDLLEKIKTECNHVLAQYFPEPDIDVFTDCSNRERIVAKISFRPIEIVLEPNHD